MERAGLAFWSLTDPDAWVLEGLGVAVGLALVLLLRVLLPAAMRGGLRFPVICLLLTTMLDVLHALLGPETPRALELLALFLILVSLGRLGFLLLVEVAINARSGRPLPRILTDILQFVVYAAGVLITLRASGVEPSSLLTTSALLTAVIGLALQETLGNLVAGLAIQAQRPFELGDWIQWSGDQKQVGRVVEINWRATRLATDDAHEVIVPNGPLAKGTITNLSKPTTILRRSVLFYAPFAVPTGSARAAVLRCLEDIPGILPQPAPRVCTNGYRDKEPMVEYVVQFYIDKLEDREAIDSTVRDRVWYALDRAEVMGRTPDLAEKELQQVTAQLQGIDFIKTLGDAEIRTLAQRIDLRRYTVGETLLREGDPGNELFIIRSGAVGIRVRGNEVARLDAGQFFGEMSLLTGEKRSATVVAVAECEMYVVGHLAVDDVLRRNPAVAEEMSRTLAARQLELEKLKSQSSTAPGTVEQRSVQLLARIRAFFSLH